METRIEERRLKAPATLMAYLENRSFLNSTESRHLEYSDKDEMAETAFDLIKELKLEEESYHQQEEVQVEEVEEEDHPEDCQCGEDDPFEPPPPKRNPYKLMSKSLEQRKKESHISSRPTGVTMESLHDDMSQYERTGIRSTSLEKVYLALKSIPPTSTEAERSFRQDSH